MWVSSCFENRFPCACRACTVDDCASMGASSALYLFFFKCSPNLEHMEILLLMLDCHRNGCGSDSVILLAQLIRKPSDAKLFL